MRDSQVEVFPETLLHSSSCEIKRALPPLSGFLKASLEPAQSTGWLPSAHWQAEPTSAAPDQPPSGRASPAGGSLSWLSPCHSRQGLRSLFCLSSPLALIFWTLLSSQLILRCRQTRPHIPLIKRSPKAASGSVKQCGQLLPSRLCITHLIKV